MYASNILKRFNMQDRKPTPTPAIMGLKLRKNDYNSKVDYNNKADYNNKGHYNNSVNSSLYKKVCLAYCCI